MKRVLLLALIAASSHAHAILDGCQLTGVDAVPAHPGPADMVAFRVDSAQANANLGSQLFSRVTNAANNLMVDIALQDSDSPLTGFKHLGSTKGDVYPIASGDALTQAIGSLATGTYPVALRIGFVDASGVYQQYCRREGFSFDVSAQSGPTASRPVIEYYNQHLDHYFITQSPAEIVDLDSGVHVGWQRTGQSFVAYVAGQSDARGSNTCRWYATPADLDTHFFSASVNECRAVRDSFSTAWKEETDDAFEIPLPDLITGACPGGTIAVYRLWNGRVDSNHRYTTSAQIRAEMVSRGYTSEGYGNSSVVMCALSGL